MGSEFKLVKLIDAPVVINTNLNPTGEYDNATTYNAGDFVSYQGFSYIAFTTTTGNLPTDTNYWQLVLDVPIAEQFETISQNLKTYDYSLNYTGDNLTSIVYTLPSVGTITKTLNYTGDQLTSVVLSGNTPSGIDLTKTLTYTGDQLTSVAYS